MRPYSPQWNQASIEMLAHAGQSQKPIYANESQQSVVDWWDNSDSRFCMILGGERAGKSWLAVRLAIGRMNLSKKGTYWIVGPDYNQARPEFLYWYNAFNDANMVEEGSVSMPLSITSPWSFKTFWGATVQTRSSGDVTKLASFSVDGGVMGEAAQQDYGAYLKLMGRVSETGGFLILAGTLEEGLPWYEDLFKRWQGENMLRAKSWSLPSWSNTAIYPGGREDIRIKELEAEYQPHDLFMERFGASPRRITGLVLPEFNMETHVKKLEVIEAYPVELLVDPGQHCYAVLFVQYDGLVCNVLDSVYRRNIIAQDIIPEVMGRPLFKKVERDHGGVIDNAGKQRQANKSQVELWQEIAGITLRGQYILLADTINTLRYRLNVANPNHAPLVYFNSHLTNAKSHDGMAMDVLAEPELWRWPARPPGRNEVAVPVDKNNDAMKALGYGLVERYGKHIEKRQLTASIQREYW